MQEFVDLLKKMPATTIAPPTNTIGHIFRHEEKENFISDWLAFLLNPDYVGSSEPLSALLQLASVQSAVDLSDVSIVRENVLGDNRRIDFIIETDSHIIGIENKIWSGLQANQLSDYKNQLTQTASDNNKDLVLILLYPQRNAHCASLTEADLCNFRPVTYEGLVNEFKHVRLNVFDNLRATVMMEDFIIHMEEYIMNESNNAARYCDMWKFEAEYRERIQKLQDELKNSKTHFGKYIESKMNALIQNLDDRDQWQTYIAIKYFQLYKKSWNNGLVHFELLNTAKDSSVPKELTVLLHTHERKDVWRTDRLKNMGNESDKKTIAICYDSPEAFEKSMNEVFAALRGLVERYTPDIDAEIIKSPDSQ